MGAEKVRIRLFGVIAEAAGRKEDEVEILPGTTVHGLLQRLAKTYGESFRSEVLDENNTGGLRDDVMLTVNGAIIDHKDINDMIVTSDANVALFSVFPGGG